jgi:hypothetical protein
MKPNQSDDSKLGDVDRQNRYIVARDALRPRADFGTQRSTDVLRRK